MTETATLKIWRGQDKAHGRWETHEVPFERGQSVLDGLRWIRVNKDATLAIRFSCINANACKECMMECDGKTVYACTARLEAREMTLEPLSNKKLVRDLVTEIAPPAERFAVQGLAVQGLAVQGLAVQGLAVQGLAVQGLAVQGLAESGERKK